MMATETAAAPTLEAIVYKAEGPRLLVLNQLLLPHQHVYEEVFTVDDGWAQIREMKVRGAPAIAIVAALTVAVVLHSKLRNGELKSKEDVRACVHATLDHLRTSRPTAVNLFNMAKWMGDAVDEEATRDDISTEGLVEFIAGMAEGMMEADIACNKAIGGYGRDALIQAANVGGGKLRVLTHCNTGSLATAGYGTALGVIRSLWEAGALERAYCTETRPYNQGARLTAYELVYEQIPATLVADSKVAFLMATRGISAVVVGADRVVANGDTANKIGTYQVAVAAKYHGVPFFVAAPTTSIDLTLATGADIHVEDRPAHELTHVQGVAVAAPGIDVWNPSFDVTPASLITGIVTERGVAYKAAGAEVFDMAGFLATR